ncbi:hypothetical protein LZ554_006158 [Drepanopeziza brunnea f. sp. 'monogermtubi']|nr:hypothetical protein LZ554_006158 [Drepanopeziza brunnea f. sp. 'monogermtubi']
MSRSMKGSSYLEQYSRAARSSQDQELLINRLVNLTAAWYIFAIDEDNLQTTQSYSPDSASGLAELPHSKPWSPETTAAVVACALERTTTRRQGWIYGWALHPRVLKLVRVIVDDDGKNALCRARGTKAACRVKGLQRVDLATAQGCAMLQLESYVDERVVVVVALESLLVQAEAGGDVEACMHGQELQVSALG